MMSKHEMALNRRDLKSFLSGEARVNSMIPGVSGSTSLLSGSNLQMLDGPQRRSNHLSINPTSDRQSMNQSLESRRDAHNLLVADKQRRLLQLGYSKE